MMSQNKFNKYTEYKYLRPDIDFSIDVLPDIRNLAGYHIQFLTYVGYRVSGLSMRQDIRYPALRPDIR